MSSNEKYVDEDIIIKYNNLTLSEKLSVMESAIGYMQSYNGRTKTNCIALAMSYKYEWDDYLNTIVYFKN